MCSLVARDGLEPPTRGVSVPRSLLLRCVIRDATISKGRDDRDQFLAALSSSPDVLEIAFERSETGLMLLVCSAESLEQGGALRTENRKILRCHTEDGVVIHSGVVVREQIAEPDDHASV